MLKVNGKQFVSAAKAAETVGYSADYVRYLCRTGDVACKRVDREWFIGPDEMDALKEDSHTDDTMVRKVTMRIVNAKNAGAEGCLAKNAAKKYGYSVDYVTSLARSGKIQAKRIGRSWYVDLDSLQAYKTIARTEQKETLRSQTRELMKRAKGSSQTDDFSTAQNPRKRSTARKKRRKKSTLALFFGFLILLFMGIGMSQKGALLHQYAKNMVGAILSSVETYDRNAVSK
jgi:hypothetical protein